MARITRIAMDLTLVSLRKIGPVISRAWNATKTFVATTPAKPIFFNGFVMKTETMIDTTSDKVVAKMVEFRNNLLPLELKYLEKELEKVKREVEMMTSEENKETNKVKYICKTKDKNDGSDDHKQSKIKSLKPRIGIAWQYFKIEAAPPLTVEFLNSPKAKNFEDVISGKTDNLIKAIESQIKQAENEELRQKEQREKEKNLKLKLADKIVKEDFKAIYKTENKDSNVKGDEKLQSSKKQLNAAAATEETKNDIPVPKSAEKSDLDVKKKK